MREATLAIRGKGELAGIGSAMGDQFFECFERHGHVGHQAEIIGSGHRNRHEILERIVRQLFVGMRLHHKIAALPADDGIAVRRGARTKVQAQLACGAGAVINNNVLTETHAKRGRNQP